LCLGACASRPGHFYQDDGPPERIPPGLAHTPDAVPRIEPLNPHANRPYAALGRSYTPDTGDAPFEQRGMASWYGRQYHGNATASGEPYDMFAMTAAHPTLPIPSYARVTRVGDGRSVIVRINDRGPFLQDRVIDLSYAAAARLGIVGPGSAEVTVEKITARDIAAGNIARPALAKAAAPAVAPAAPQPPAASAAPQEIAAEAAPEPPPAALPTPLAISTRVVASAQSPQELPLPPPPTAPGPSDSTTQAPAVPPAPPVAPVISAPQAPAPRPPDPPGAGLPLAPAVPVAAAPVTAAPPAIASPTAPPAAEPATAAPPPESPPRAESALAAQPPPATAATAAGAGAAPPAVKAAAAGAPAAPATGPWSIQLGAFALPDHAQALASTVGALLAGPGAEALPAANRAVRVAFDGRLHRVLVGGYADRSGAQRGARQLQEFLGRDTTVYRP
jgi:rare lipoprotein A